MKKLFSIILIFIATAFAATAQVADYRLNVQNFCELKVVDGVRVECSCRADSAGWAVFSCHPDMAAHIMFGNKAEVLTIQTDADTTTIVGVPLIRVYAASLRCVENSGDSLVTVSAAVPVDEFKAKQIGNGKLEVHDVDAKHVDASILAGNGSIAIDGKAAKATIKNVSTGPIDASQLAVGEAKCMMLGTGDIECAPSDKLRIFGAGSGIVVYHGKPGKITNRGIGVKAVSSDDPSAWLVSKR